MELLYKIILTTNLHVVTQSIKVLYRIDKVRKYGILSRRIGPAVPSTVGVLGQGGREQQNVR